MWCWWRTGWLVAALFLCACGRSDLGDELVDGDGGTGASTHASGETTIRGGSWIRQLGTASDEEARHVAVDAQGNIVVLSVTNGDEWTLWKLDSAGNVVFNVPVSGWLDGVAVAPEGDIFVVGTVTVSVTQTGGLDTDVILRGYTPEGSARFTQRFGLAGDYDSALRLSLENRAHPWVLWASEVGDIGTRLLLSDFAPNVAEVSRTDVTIEDSYSAVFLDDNGHVLYVDGLAGWVRKLDHSGATLWTTPLDGIAATSIDVDAQGNVLLIGGDSTLLSTSTFTKLAADGTVMFTTEFGGADYPAELVGADPRGNVFVAGETAQGPATTWDVFVRRFDARGGELNRWTLGSDARDVPYEMAVDASGAAVIVGYVAGTVAGQMALGGRDLFVARVAP